MTCLKRVSICWYIFTLFSSQSTASVVISTMNETSNVDALRPHRCIRCSGHQPQSAEAVKRVRLDAIKRTILQKLRLSLPHGVARADLPRLTEPLRRLHAVAGEDNGNQDYFYGHRTHIAIIAHEVTDCASEKTCLNLNLKQIGSSPVDITEAKLWVYVGRTLTGHDLTLSELVTPTSDIRLQSRARSYANGWHTFDLQAVVKGWLRNSQENVTVEVACPTCSRSKPLVTTGSAVQPLLQMATGIRRKTKRRLPWCGRGETRCCRVPLYVSFVDFGWTWILEPAGFWANYCHGQCDVLSMPVYPHSRLVANTMHGMELLTCCTPSKLSRLSILYVNTQGLIIKSNVPNMIVETCGCA